MNRLRAWLRSIDMVFRPAKYRQTEQSVLDAFCKQAWELGIKHQHCVGPKHKGIK